VPEHDSFQWPAPWAPVGSEAQRLGLPRARNAIFGSDAPADSLAEELRREVCAGHPLFGHTCTPVAYNREDENEFVFVTSNPAMPVAFVHLTWEVEARPSFPWTAGYQSLEHFASDWIKPRSTPARPHRLVDRLRDLLARILFSR
jgi:hypothetical protein